ncbi:nucleoside recognition domain-containing protein [Achromobacter sp. DH1f]|uniref:nucleoside recognition domain-containing protein n=1 Tax=Achromobacter sp. DH1f TaxID=1397275 RepID=UPI00046A7F4C|nr:nucleoside recognition domain-containing protein [Achromobacter sp. DH1f]
MTPANADTVVLAGLENAGKSALFRSLTGQAIGDENNVPGSTVACREAWLRDTGTRLVDTPGVRLREDSAATRLALARLTPAAVVAVVMRVTDAPTRMRELLAALAGTRRVCVVLTFADKCDNGPALAARCGAALGVPVAAINARAPAAQELAAVHAALAGAVLLPAAPAPLVAWRAAGLRRPQRTPFDHARLGAWWALLALLSMFALPVVLAYLLSGWLQPLADAALVQPLTHALAATPAALQTVLVGSYGLVSLGLYSFIWAFPVVALIGVSMALSEESGLKDRMTAALDPALRHIGLSGRDLIPVLSGFGCNVVATFQSRGCSACTRRACVSLIAFGSACSYQIGATLSVFGAAGRLWLFAPYLFLLFAVGAAHTRLWHGALQADAAAPLSGQAYLQWPSWRGVAWRLRAVLAQFLKQAMPVFLLICLFASLLQGMGAIQALSSWLAAPMAALGLPAQAAGGVVFSLLRKDGLLALNQGQGALLAQLSAAQTFVVVWLASTCSACLVTLWTVGRELGARHAWGLAGRQAATSLVSAWVLAQVLI